MIRSTVVAVLAVMMTAIVNAQGVPIDLGPGTPITCEPLPPADVITGGDKLADDELELVLYNPNWKATATLRQVTGGVMLNWMGQPPPWALSPETDAFYAWEEGYGAYCRHFSRGTDRTRQTDCRTDCLRYDWGGWYYQSVWWTGTWRVVALEKLGTY